MKEVTIPGGTAHFRERDADEISGRAVKIMRAAAVAAATTLADYPQLFEPPRAGESDEQREERLNEELKGVALSTEQAMAWDNMREATVVALLADWTLERPLPTLQTIGDLPEKLYDALLDAVGGVSAADLETDFNPGTENDENGEPRPTSGSGS